jgi:alkaline phosphatase D
VNRLACFAAALCLLPLVTSTSADDSQVISRIGFGSCAKQNRPQPIWDAVVESNPQLFLMIGDNIYGDTEDMDVLWKKYQMLDAQPGFRKLRATCPLLGTWDDHDYGVNDGGVGYPRKRESQQLFLDFFRVSRDSPRRQREGVYHARTFGPPGKRVQVILTDSRYFRSPLTRSSRKAEPGEGYRGVYEPQSDPDLTMLGDAQWKWLEEQLRAPAEFRILASSVQVLPTQHGWEMWGLFPRERQRLLNLIRDTKAGGVVFISGDRHLAEQMRIEPEESTVSYPLLETTSSSLNAPSGNFTKAGVRFGNERNRYREGLTFFDVNFGTILIDWELSDPIFRMQVRDEKGGVVLQQRMSLSEISYRP